MNTCKWCGSSKHASKACHIRLGTCAQPDRDVSGLKCGYSLPCPHHTATIDTATGGVTIPLELKVGMKGVNRLRSVGRALRHEDDETMYA